MPDCLFSDSSTSWDLDGVANYEGLLAMTAFARRQRLVVNDVRTDGTREVRNERGGDCFAGALLARMSAEDDCWRGVALCQRSSRADRKRRDYGAVAPLPRQEAVQGVAESQLTQSSYYRTRVVSLFSVSCAQRSKRPMRPRRQSSSYPGSTSEISLVAGTSISRTGWNAKIVQGS